MIQKTALWLLSAIAGATIILGVTCRHSTQNRFEQQRRQIRDIQDQVASGQFSEARYQLSRFQHQHRQDLARIPTLDTYLNLAEKDLELAILSRTLGDHRQPTMIKQTLDSLELAEIELTHIIEFPQDFPNLNSKINPQPSP